MQLFQYEDDKRLPFIDAVRSKTGFTLISVLTEIIAFCFIFNTFDMALHTAAYTVLLSLPVFGIFLMLFRRCHIAVCVSSWFWFLLYYADQFILSARLTHIRFSDFTLIRQAMRVSGRYSPIWNMDLTLKLLIPCIACVFILLMKHAYKPEVPKLFVFLTGLIAAALSLVLAFTGVIPTEGEGFDYNQITEERGLLYSWYCQVKESRLQEPEGYSPEYADSILGRYTATEASGEDVDIIVVMNESLADYSLTGKEDFEDPLPYIHSLVKDGKAFEGKLEVNVFGGGTSTTEYEFLTGNSTLFLPDTGSPYLTYVTKDTENLASELKDAGYSTKAIHPYYSEEWNRTQVYKFFGFDKFISGEDFGGSVNLLGKSATQGLNDARLTFGDGVPYVRNLIGDETGYKRLLAELEDTSFIFNVTIQNHGGYMYKGDDFTNTEYVSEKTWRPWKGIQSLGGAKFTAGGTEKEDDVFKTNQYLTCARLSDDAFRYLIGELEKSDKKTIVLMFGDHQPGILIGEHFTDAGERTDNATNIDYVTPYIVWSNFETDTEFPEHVSVNYLSAILKKAAGAALTPWDLFRLDMMEQYPVATTKHIFDKDGNQAPKSALEEYEFVQYKRMFG